jgi:hypothetical protein
MRSEQREWDGELQEGAGCDGCRSIFAFSLETFRSAFAIYLADSRPLYQPLHMLSVSTPRKRFLEEDGLERISSINISCPRGADADSISTPPKKSRATAGSPAQIERPTFFPLGQSFPPQQHYAEFFFLTCFAVNVSSLSCEAQDMPALHRKVARMRCESYAAASTSCAASSSEEKVYSNADVSKMVKDAVSSAVAHTKEMYEKILQEKLAGLFFLSF